MEPAISYNNQNGFIILKLIGFIISVYSPLFCGVLVTAILYKTQKCWFSFIFFVKKSALSVPSCHKETAEA
jgi:hypothetical protein